MTKFVLVENDTKNFEQAMNGEMEKSVKHFDGELVKIRVGRAHTSLIEKVMVSAHGAPAVPLKQMAILGAPDARLLTIQPWDTSLIPDIEKAIRSSDVGLSPANDGKIIRLELPEMSHARRDELVKVLHKKLEDGKIAMRKVRQDFNNILRDAKKDKAISENFYNRLLDILQKITDKYIARIEQLAEKKEKEVRTV